MKDTLNKILDEMKDAKLASLDPKALTKRTGEYRIGLTRAEFIVRSVIIDLEDDNIEEVLTQRKLLIDFMKWEKNDNLVYERTIQQKADEFLKTKK